MLFNYLKISFRNLIKHKTFSAINILGLSFSLSVCLLMITLINDQMMYDQFHVNKDRIYRITTDIKDQHQRSRLHASTTIPIGEHLVKEYTGVEEAVSITRRLKGEAKSNDKFLPLNGFFTSPNFFEVFSFELSEGDKAHAFDQANAIVLSEEMARSFYGDEKALGRTIELGNKGSFVVTGVIKKPPYKSHLQFEALASNETEKILEKQGKLYALNDNWSAAWMGYVYVLLEKGTQPEQVAAFFPEIQQKHHDESMEHEFQFQMQSLNAISPGKIISNAISNPFPLEGIYIIGALALIIMISACFNYGNLSISRALTRAREVGIRKVSGARRRQIVLQFLSESVLFIMISLVFAIIIFQFLLQAFNQSYIATFTALNIEENIWTYGLILAFSILVGILAGIAPALFLSSFDPIKALKDLSGKREFSWMTVRKSLIVVQFVISLFFIITAITISKQSNRYIQGSYGFQSENIINIRLQDADGELFLNEINSRSDVIAASLSSHLPVSGKNYGTDIRLNATDKKQQLYFFYVDQGYVENLDLTLVAGRNFPDYQPGANESHIILNETAIRSLGFSTANDAISEHVLLGSSDTTYYQIVGVVKDYNYKPLMTEIQPMALRYRPQEFKYANMKINSDDIESTIAGLKTSWLKFDKSHAFEYRFFDDQVKESYAVLKDIIAIISISAILAVVVASLGLFGMAVYNAESRIKEVGIRKVLGAHIGQIVLLLSNNYLLLLVISIVIAVPLAYFANSLWLQQIANRIILGPGIIGSGIGIILLIGIITIGSQSIRAAFTNPVDSLRDE